MPIRPEMKPLYPPDWAAISLRVRTAAAWRCQCIGECGRPVKHLTTDGRCFAVDARHMGDWAVMSERGPSDYEIDTAGVSGKPVVLTVAHLDHDPTNCEPSNLRAYCQGCHLWYDREHHRQTATKTRLTRQMALGQLILEATT